MDGHGGSNGATEAFANGSLVDGADVRSFGRALREAREAQGLSRAFIAELLEVSEAAVLTWEQHTVPEPGSFKKLIESFPALAVFDRNTLTAKRSFAVHLRMLREGRGLSRLALAKLTDVDASTVRGWERGTKPRTEQVARLLGVFPELEQSFLSRRRSARRSVRGAETAAVKNHPASGEPEQSFTGGGALFHLHALVRAEVAPHVVWLLRSVAAGQCSAKTLVEMLSLATGTTDSDRCDG